jgi:hypothetical protein
VQARSEPVVFEAARRRISDRHLAVLGLGLVLAAVCILLAFQVLPIGFIVILVLILLYPGIGIWKTLRRDWGPAAPRLLLGPEALEAGRDLRIRWKDITEVAARQPSGAKPGTAERICIRVNRLAPVMPVPSTLRRLGLGGYDGYFDITIPAVYGVSAAQMAAALEERRARAAAAPALGAQPKPPATRRRKPRRPTPPATP